MEIWEQVEKHQKQHLENPDFDYFVFCNQGCHGQGKISGKRNFFQLREKTGNFVDDQGNLGRTLKGKSQGI